MDFESRAAALRAGGFDTAVAADDTTAVAMARSGTFDLLILDLKLPGPAAFGVPGVLRRVRRDRQPAPNLLRHGDLLLEVRTRQAWTPLGSVELTGRGSRSSRR